MTFSADWLALREPYDLAARNPAVLDEVVSAFMGQSSISVVDLGCGTGSTLRAVTKHLPSRQSWRLVDNDLGLLARAANLAQPPGISIVTRPVDLVRDLELALEGPLDLVTLSALLDLVSLEWLDRLAIEAAARRLPVYAALTYDGRARIAPSESADPEILARVNAHQRTDKGFGPALGPSAGARAVERFVQVGYEVAQGQSDWLLGSEDRAIQEVLFAGWAELAMQSSEGSSGVVSDWLACRRSHLAVERSSLTVGHLDIFARPIGMR
jgi:hypothetical protein